MLGILGKAAAMVVVLSAGFALVTQDLEDGLNLAMALITLIGLVAVLVRFRKQQEAYKTLKQYKYTPYQLRLLGGIAYVPGADRERLQFSDELRRQHKGK
ncbi:hypothetical protein IT411_02260 [Candidatus Peregrinibacteria bacterium]|nr:hypothetical protein [Candidatus Peregrinibacteria bacterium]